jgi:hypothetical protein
MTLKAAIEKALREAGHPLTSHEIAAAINSNKWFVYRGNIPLPARAVFAVIDLHRSMFRRNGDVISLVQPLGDGGVHPPAVVPQVEEVTSPTDLPQLLETFAHHCFDPLVDTADSLPKGPGNYIMCLRPDAILPSAAGTPTFVLYNGLRVLYTGATSTNLRSSIYLAHFCGTSSVTSSVRRSIGVMMGYKRVPVVGNTIGTLTIFGMQNEVSVAEWMRQNVCVYWIYTHHCGQVDALLLAHFNAPLNLKHNRNAINAPFREALEQMRKPVRKWW